MREKSYKIVTGIFTAVLVLFVVAAIVVGINIYMSHDKDFTVVQTAGSEDSRIAVDIHPRGGQGDTWEKLACAESEDEILLNGITYAAVINNKMDIFLAGKEEKQSSLKKELDEISLQFVNNLKAIKGEIEAQIS